MSSSEKKHICPDFGFSIPGLMMSEALVFLVSLRYVRSLQKLQPTVACLFGAEQYFRVADLCITI